MNITEIHSLLSKKEMQKFGDFIKSPFFNSEPRFIKLFEVIRSEGAKINKEIISKKIFGENTSPGDLRFRKLISEFMKLFERFLAEIEFSSDELNQKFMVLEKYKKMNLRKEFLKQADDTINYIDNYTTRDEIYYKNMADVYSKKYSVEEINFKDYSEDLSFTINEYTDKYFMAMKLFIFQRITSFEYTFNADLTKNKTFYNNILFFIEENRTNLKKADPEIYLRYLELKLDSEGYSDILYNEYLETIEVETLKINKYTFYSSLINILSKFINTGQTIYYQKVIEVSKIMETRDLFRINGLSYIDFKIIIESAISIQELKWAIEFSQNNKDHILHENKESVYMLMMGKLYFFNGDFPKAKELLSGISVNDYIHYTEAKLIECRIEFELENFNAVLDLASTTKKYLKLHKVIGKHFSEVYNMFLNSLLKLVRIIENEQNTTDLIYELDRIGRDLMANKVPIYAQSWLLGKINELKKGRL